MSLDPKTTLDDQDDFPGMEPTPNDDYGEEVDGVDLNCQFNHGEGPRDLDTWEIEDDGNDRDPSELQDGK